MSDKPPIIRRGASHATIWTLWSAAEVKRLAVLPPAELLLAVQTGATIDLTKEDQGKILAVLAASGYGHVAPTITVMPKPHRKPLPFGGRGLPCKARPPDRPGCTQIWLAVAVILITWGVVVGCGYAAVTPPTYAAP